MNLTKQRKQIKRDYSRAVREACKVVELLARELLLANPDMDEFIMGMGRWMIVLKNGDYIHDEQQYKYPKLKRLNVFIDDWDKYLCITGCPIRFTAKGKAKYDW